MQSAFFDRCALRAVTDPRWACIFAIPNGAHKSYAQAAKFQREGLKKGVPDTFVAVAAGKYHGFFIEFKRPGEKCSPEQNDWLGRMDRNGYYCAVMFDAEEAEKLVDWYFAKGAK